MNNAATQPSHIIGDPIEPLARATQARAPLELVVTEPAADTQTQRRSVAASRRADARRAQAASRALLVRGLDYAAQLLEQAEERQLLKALEALPLSPAQGPRAPGERWSLAFGWNDDFGQSGFAHADPMPDFLLALRTRVAAFSGVAAEQWQQASVAVDEPRTGEWQMERPVFEQFVEITLGGHATLRLRQRASEGFDRHTLPLAPGSAYLLSGDARHCWERRLDHGSPMSWTVRFRTLSSRGLRR